MFAMYKLFVATALAALLAGCASLYQPPVATADAGITLEMTSSGLVFRNVRVENTPQEASLVKGTLRRVGRRPVRAGQLDYRLTDADGRILEQGKASDGGTAQLARPGQTAMFSIPLHRRWIPGQQHLYLKWDGAAHADAPT
jgi:hypothetical protein